MSFYSRAVADRIKTGVIVASLMVAMFAAAMQLHAWSDSDFDHRILVAYPLPPAPDNMIGEPSTYVIKKGDTLLDVGRWYDLSATEISNANNHMDWWSPPVGRTVLLPIQRILPDGPREGIVLNIPEMRLYYFPPRGELHSKKGKLTKAAATRASYAPKVAYTFPVGLGRFDWRTPVGAFKVRGKTRDPAWVVPDDIYQEHLERDGEAEHMIPGGDPDNPLGRYRIELTLPLYALHGTNVPWGVGMEVSHGCIRLYPEDIEQLFNLVRIGVPGRFVYQPVKFGFRGDSVYVEVHDDLYGRYPGLWNHTVQEVHRLNLEGRIDPRKLEKAVEEKTGVPTDVTLGSEASAPTTPETSAPTTPTDGAVAPDGSAPPDSAPPPPSPSDGSAPADDDS
ncbi:MAG TPA: L,D-transpeptidase family protein [Candidatus Binataceae bacterium]|nr:L,D-transpeptidase family protein [Candidatus Binataceae bacterium]